MDLLYTFVRAGFPSGNPWMKSGSVGLHRRVLRGGSWIDNNEINLRSSNRNNNTPTNRNNNIGFRCVVEAGKASMPIDWRGLIGWMPSGRVLPGARHPVQVEMDT